MANLKEGKVDVDVGGTKMTLRFSLRAMRELKERFGKSLPQYMQERGEKIDPDDIAAIFAAAGKAGGTPVSEEDLLDLMDMPSLPEYVQAMVDALSASGTGKAASESAPFPKAAPSGNQ